MNYKVLYTEKSKKQLKKLNKKYKSLKKDLREFEKIVVSNYKNGILLFDDVYKIRMKIFSTGKGKSGGARVIYYVVINKKQIIVLSIYDKSDIENLSKSDIKKIMKNEFDNI